MKPYENLPNMNVLQVVPELNAGGVERTTLEMAQALTSKGHKAHVISLGGRMEDELMALGGILHKTNIGSKNIFTVMRRARLLRAIMRKYEIDIIHARSRAPAWPAFIAAKAEKVPFLTTYHGIYNGVSGPKRFYNSVMTKGARIIANSEFTKNHIIKTHGTPADKIMVVPRGVDMKNFDPKNISPQDVTAQRNRWRIAPDKKVILLPGRLTRWKGQLVAVEALAQLPNDCVLVLLGDAQGRESYLSEIKTKTAQLELNERVILPGHSRDVPTALMASDVIISASTDPEAFGRVAAEAQAMGRPIIATAHGGTLETVIDGKTGYFVPPSDAAALAQAIERGLNWTDYDAQTTRKRIADQFSKENLQLKTLSVYKDLLNS